jgi:hypothetical protein
MESGQRVVAMEVKATATPRPTDARHLAYVRDRVVAVPVSDLWA